MTVLILTCEEDVTADMVVVHLNASGVPVVRIDPADLTGGVALSGEYVHGAFRGHLSSAGRLVSVSGLRSIWVRRPGAPATRAAEPSEWLTEEASQALYGMLRGSGARWMNHPDAAPRAPSQAVAAASRPAQRTARAGHPDHHLPAGRPRVLGALPGPGGQARFRRPSAGSAQGGADQPGRTGHRLRRRRVRPRCCSGGSPSAPTSAHRGGRPVAGRPHGDRRRPRPRGGRRPLHLTRAALVSHRRPARASPTPSGHTCARPKLAYGAFDFAEDGDGTWWFPGVQPVGPVRLRRGGHRPAIAHSIAEWLSRPAADREGRVNGSDTTVA